MWASSCCATQAVSGGELAVQGERQLLLLIAQFSLTEAGELRWVLSGDEPLDHASRRDSVDVGDHGSESDAGVIPCAGGSFLPPGWR